MSRQRRKTAKKLNCVKPTKAKLASARERVRKRINTTRRDHADSSRQSKQSTDENVVTPHKRNWRALLCADADPHYIERMDTQHKMFRPEGIRREDTRNSSSDLSTPETILARSQRENSKPAKMKQATSWCSKPEGWHHAEHPNQLAADSSHRRDFSQLLPTSSRRPTSVTVMHIRQGDLHLAANSWPVCRSK